eukprot:CAMPEP_0204591270 /NCGR_PEP_ID=MMETSP0661-20131031/50262_1 /ASSEMBLY_ACC=CAM_ASM_000606 /TAXON_ID=109239 /ORGANISM="Alexandrium margalefi, Strain AMGDE01CS-322" /LENGTH=266 /DNA_ID=CAMNT_0051601377 /DNA_START=60 /DNA_END=860 /DNA_ORIENTATION=-
MTSASWYEDFAWEGAPLSHWCWPVLGVSSYLLGILVLSVVMRSREAFQLRNATVAHNLVLSAGSLAMFLGAAVELWRRRARSGGLEWFFCEDARSTEGPLYFWSYIYYLSKYYEMFDTILVLLQKSRVPNFKLQVYHHAAVAPMIWCWCHYRMSLQWGGLLFNTFVHIVMYHYYAWRVLGLPTPWKRWITKLQIVQFVASFILITMTMRIVLQKQNGDACAGMTSLMFNLALNATLLFQFIGVDRQNVGRQKREEAPGGSADSKQK